MRQDAGWKHSAPAIAVPSAEPRLVWESHPGRPAPAALDVIAQLACRAPQPFDDIEDFRRRYEACRKPFLAERVAVDSVFHVHPRGGDGPAVSVIRPIASTGRKAMPAILFLHGGGWTAGTFDTYEPLCRRLAKRDPAASSSMSTIGWLPSIRFRRPSTTRVPLWRWAHANSGWLGIDPDRIGPCRRRNGRQSRRRGLSGGMQRGDGPPALSPDPALSLSRRVGLHAVAQDVGRPLSDRGRDAPLVPPELCRRPRQTGPVAPLAAVRLRRQPASAVGHPLCRFRSTARRSGRLCRAIAGERRFRSRPFISPI